MLYLSILDEDSKTDLEAARGWINSCNEAAVLNFFGASGCYTCQYSMRIPRRIWRQQEGGSTVATVDILNYIQVGFTVPSFTYDPSPCILQEIQSKEERVYAEMKRQAKYLEVLIAIEKQKVDEKEAETKKKMAIS